MFGDPFFNPRCFPKIPLGQIGLKFSDGPFGSNLKSSHYTSSGVRVIRLQNIGVGQFHDTDRAFISEEHYEKLRKHECLPGDVLVGTLGDPNLRACMQPSWVDKAINKADCVQIRPRDGVATSEYICSLLNQPSTQRMASDLINGQTRTRISMGRLKTLVVAVPPFDMQVEYSCRMRALTGIADGYADSRTHLDSLFFSLQQRAFQGAL